MASSPDFKVYFGKEYIAACKHVEDAAALVAFRGVGATIRCGHKFIAWEEGDEEQPAAESYDYVVETVHQRVETNRFEASEKRRREAERIAELHKTGQATLGARRESVPERHQRRVEENARKDARPDSKGVRVMTTMRDLSIEGEQNQIGETNDRQREIIAEVRDSSDYGEAWLGRINAEHGFTGDKLPPLRKWDGELVYNFGADFVLPRFDDGIERMILEFRDAPWNVADMRKRIDEIFESVEALGGKVLLWS